MHSAHWKQCVSIVRLHSFMAVDMDFIGIALDFAVKVDFSVNYFGLCYDGDLLVC